MVVDPSVVAAMATGFSAIVALIVGGLGWIAKRSDRQAEKDLRAAEIKAARQDKLEERVDNLQAELEAALSELREVKDLARDRGELVEDAIPVMIDVAAGRHVPKEAVNWRWRNLIRALPGEEQTLV
ncbi:hypothetical protein [Kocuria sp.]|uniref:hypothetical protein n=1 Tax=Kocuria sp. TaxID=1871328 RepID=UPI0026E05602|nr:hypothetical protein [Kocuria sp.]MDO5619260.1 hypothetical protein [Kocuria sp.]